MPEPDAKRLFKERDELRNAIVDTLHTWAAVETHLATFLANILMDKPGELAFAIYFAPTNLETRFKLVDAAFAVAAAGRPTTEIVLKDWSFLLRTLFHVERRAGQGGPRANRHLPREPA